MQARGPLVLQLRAASTTTELWVREGDAWRVQPQPGALQPLETVLARLAERAGVRYSRHTASRVTVHTADGKQAALPDVLAHGSTLMGQLYTDGTVWVASTGTTAEREGVECPVCCCPTTRLVRVCTGGHTACPTCVVAHIRAGAALRPHPCMSDGCSEQLSAEARALLRPEEAAALPRYDELVPTPCVTCGNAIIVPSNTPAGTALHCTTCDATRCSLCGDIKFSTTRAACERCHRALLRGSATMLNGWYGLVPQCTVSADVVEAAVRRVLAAEHLACPCPVCGVQLEWAGDCFELTCPSGCGVAVCWLCGKAALTSDGGLTLHYEHSGALQAPDLCPRYPHGFEIGWACSDACCSEAAACTRPDHAQPRMLLHTLRRFIHVRMLCASAPPAALEEAVRRMEGVPHLPSPLVRMAWRAEAAAAVGLLLE